MTPIKSWLGGEKSGEDASSFKCVSVSEIKSKRQENINQRVCKLLLERHGERLFRVLVSGEPGKAVLRQLVAASLRCKYRSLGTSQSKDVVLIRLLEKYPSWVMNVLLNGTGRDVVQQLSYWVERCMCVFFVHKIKERCSLFNHLAMCVLRTVEERVRLGVAHCMLRGVSAADVSLLEPVTETLAAALVDELEFYEGNNLGDSEDFLSHSQPAGSCAAATEDVRTPTVRPPKPYFDPVKRRCFAFLGTIVRHCPTLYLLRSQSRVKWLIEQQHQKCRVVAEHQNQEKVLKQRTRYGMTGNSSIENIVQSAPGTGERGVSAEIWREVLLMCTSDTSSPEVEASCGKIVQAAPPVLAKIIKIEAMKEDELQANPDKKSCKTWRASQRQHSLLKSEETEGPTTNR